MTALQEREFLILKQIMNLLDANHIEYCLAYGSVLGAIRHKGFIPWDDDVDIFVKAKDYEKIRELYRSTDTGTIQFHDYKTVKGYPYVFPKVVDTATELRECAYDHLDYMCGVYVDIFPVFEVSDNAVAYWLDEKRTYLQYGLVKFYYQKESANKAVAFLERAVKKVINVDRAQEKLFHRYTASKITGSRLKEPNVFSKEQLIKKEYFKAYTDVVFEDIVAPVFEDYDGYLTDTYGDYMTPPPRNQQVSVHNFSHMVLKKG